jgi:hypothetical protein
MPYIYNSGPPAGWTVKQSGSVSKFSWRRATGSEIAPTLAPGYIGQIAAFRGAVATGDPFETVSSSVTNKSVGPAGATATAQAVTTVTPGAMVLALLTAELLDTQPGYPIQMEYVSGPATTRAFTNSYTGTDKIGIGLFFAQKPQPGAATAQLTRISAQGANLYGSASTTMWAIRPAPQ